MQNQKVQMLTESAVMVALAAVLALVQIPLWPQGGSITLVSMLPIIFISLRYSTGWGLLTGFVYALVQLVQGLANVPPVKDGFAAFILCILLDYVIAFTVLGLAGLIRKPFRNRVLGCGVATAAVIFLRFLCHFLSGILIWGAYAEGMPVWLYSLTYNGSYMGVELVITTTVVVLLSIKFDFRTFMKK